MRTAQKPNLSSRAEYGQLIAAIAASRNGVSLDSLAGSCDVDRATIKRWVSRLRVEFGAPITSNRNGYFWRPSPDQRRRADALMVVFCEAPM